MEGKLLLVSLTSFVGTTHPERTRPMRTRRLISLATFAVIALVSSCVDAEVSPTAQTPIGTATFAVVPTFSGAVASSAAQAGDITRIRVTARLQSTAEVLATFTQDVDPAANEWTLTVEIQVPASGGQAVLTIELVSVASDGGETVEFSGQTQPISLTTGGPTQAREVPVGRGTIENLGVTGLTIEPTGDTLVIGGSTSVSAATTPADASNSHRIFFSSLDPTIATVSDNGTVTAVLDGSARIVAAAGLHADTSAILVLKGFADLSILKRLTNEEQSSFNEGDAISYTVVVDNFGPLTASNVQVLDSADAGLTLLSGQVTSGTFDVVSGVWVLDSIVNGATDTLVVLARVDAGTVEQALWNRARHLGLPLQVDTAAGNDVDSVEIHVVEPEADVNITKQLADDTRSYFEGDTVEFMIAVENFGPGVATAVQVLDSLDKGLTYSHVADAAPFDVTSGVWTVGVLENGASDTLRLFAVIDSGTAGVQLWNRARSLGLTNQVDLDPTNDADSVSVSVSHTNADLNVSKALVDNSATYFEGDTVEFRVIVDNFGPATATLLALRDSLGSGMSLVSLSPLRGLVDIGTGTWELDSIVGGMSDTLVVAAQIDSGTVGQRLTNYAWSVGLTEQLDTVTSNDAASAWLSVDVQSADINVTKTADNTLPFPGDTTTWMIVIDNFGPYTAKNVTVLDQGDSIMIESFSVTSGTVDTVNGVWTIPSIPDGGSDTLLVRSVAKVGQVGDTLWNRVRVQPLTTEIDPDSTNNADSTFIFVQQRYADLNITKTVSDNEPSEGDSIVYTVVVENFGPHDANNVRLKDMSDSIPTTGDWVVTATQGFTDDSTWTVGTIPSGGADTLQLRMQLDSQMVGDTLWNRVLVDHLDEVDSASWNDADSAFIVLDQKVANVALHKFVDNAMPYEGDTITYIIELQNFGTHTAESVQIYDSLQAFFDGDLTVTSRTLTNGTFDTLTSVWTVGPLAPGQTDSLRLSFRIDSGTVSDTIVNHARVSALFGAAEFDTTNDYASASAVVGQKVANVVLHKFVDNTMPYEGDTIAYTIELQNFGTHTADSVQIYDSLQAFFDGDLTVTSRTLTNGTFDTLTSVWTVGPLAPGQTDSLRLAFQVDSGTVSDTLVNHARVSKLFGAAESDTTNDYASASAVVGQKTSDLALSMGVGNTMPFEGDTVTFFVELHNYGSFPVVVKDVQISQTHDSTLSEPYANAPTTGTWNGSVWAIDSIVPGGTDTLFMAMELQVGMSVPGDTLRNSFFVVTSHGAFDTDPTNDTASAFVVHQQRVADLSVVKTVDNTNPSEGEDHTYTTIMRNVGTLPVGDVVLNDPIPAGLSYVSRSSSHGAFNHVTGLWDLGSIVFNPGDTAWLSVTLDPDPGSIGTTIQNTATLATPLDANSVNDTSSVAVTVHNADLFEMSKTVDNATPSEGEDFTYTVIFRNIGPSELENVDVYDSIPAGLIYVSRSTSHGDWNNTTGLWDLGSTIFNPGDTAWLYVTLRPAIGASGTTIWNRAWGSPDQTDAQTTNNMDSVTVNPIYGGYVDVTMSVTNASPQEGETVQHEITVTNNGAGTATSVNLLDSLPTTVGDKTLVGGFPTQGSWVSGASNWSVANLPAVDPKHDGSIAEGARGHFDAEPPWRGPDAALRQRGITDD